MLYHNLFFLQQIKSIIKKTREDSTKFCRQFDKVRWRNWIAHLTTDQEVAGSSPARIVQTLPFHF